MEIKRLRSSNSFESLFESMNKDIRLINEADILWDEEEMSKANEMIIEMIQIDYHVYQIKNQVQRDDEFYQQIFDEMEVEDMECMITMLLINIKASINRMKKRIDDWDAEFNSDPEWN